MHALALLTLLPSQFVDSRQFSWDLQQAAFQATAATYHPRSRSNGTAIIVGRKDGKTYLLTAAHVVSADELAEGRDKEDPNKVELRFFSPRITDHVVLDGDARVVARMPNEDLAVLSADLKNAPKPMPICPRDSKSMAGLKPPFDVMTLGIVPDGGPEIQIDKVKDRRVVRKTIRKPDGREVLYKALYWEAVIPQQLGRSGGAMIDTDGYVIGIASGIEHGNGYYTHIDEIHWNLVRENLGWLFGYTPARK